MQGYAPACRDEAFTGAREQFAETEEWLAGEAAGLQHAELEEQLEARGRELMRRLFQGHLDLLAASEERRDDVVGGDGVVRTRAERGRTRPLVTRFGQVSVSRIAYRSPGRSNVHVLDRALNLPEEKHSHGLRKLAAIEAARGSMEVRAPRSPARPAYDRETAGRGAGTPLRRARGGVLPAPGDRSGAGGMAADPDLRREGHRDAARGAAPGHRESRGIRGGQAGDPAVARGEARPQADGRAGLRLDAVPVPRTPEDVISTPAQKRRKRKAQAAAPKKKGKPREPQARGKWLTASVTDDIPAVIAAAFGEAGR